MNNEQILRKAIEKAVKNGFNLDRGEINYLIDALPTKDYYYTIFSHDFAKAFWGEGHLDYFNYNGRYSEYDGSVLYGRRISTWQYHLQQMVLEDDKLKYLEKFL